MMNFDKMDETDIFVICIGFAVAVMFAIALIGANAILWSFPIMWCWNYLAVSWVEFPFTIPTLTWVQAFALYITGSMLLREGSMHVKFGAVGQFFLSLFLVILSTLSSFVLQWSWNHSLVTIFGFPLIEWWQSFCLLFLCNSLIKGNGVHQHKEEIEKV